MGLKLSIDGSEYSRRAAKGALKEAEDFALLEHRKRFMPLHFKTVAFQRYPEPYHTKNNPARKQVRTKKQKRSDYVRGRAVKKQAEKNGFKRDQSKHGKANKLPLVATGLLRFKILNGGIDLTGRYDKRTMKFNPPFYVFINPAGQINKPKAVEYISPSEESALVKILEARFTSNLEK